MGDSWEDDDWESENFKVELPTGPKAAPTAAADPQAVKFAGEDEEEQEHEPAWKAAVPQPQKPNEGKKKKTYEDREGNHEADEPLDDPVAEKLRQQRLIEESDIQAARELFGSSASKRSTDSLLDSKPVSLKEHEDYARSVVSTYLLQHSKNQHYKGLLKALVKAALAPVGVQEVKDLEACLAGVRADKLKEEKAAKEAKKVGGKKKSINAGAKGGSAGLDDYKYDDVLDNDDFM